MFGLDAAFLGQSYFQFLANYESGELLFKLMAYLAPRTMA